MKGFDGIKLRIFAFFTLSMLFLVPFISAFMVIFRFKYFIIKDHGSAKPLFITIMILCFVRFFFFGLVTDILYDDMYKKEQKYEKTDKSVDTDLAHLPFKAVEGVFKGFLNNKDYVNLD